MTMVANNYLDEGRPHREVIEMMALGFTGKLQQWWNNCLTEASKEDINGLPTLFSQKVKETLCSPLGVIDYDNLTYGGISSTIRSEGMKMCRDFKIQNHINKNTVPLTQHY